MLSQAASSGQQVRILPMRIPPVRILPMRIPKDQANLNVLSTFGS
jgi:hypothetical protein